MIYSDTCGKLELYERLYENSLIGSDISNDWDLNQPLSPEVPRRYLRPDCIEKYFGPAPSCCDPDFPVYRYHFIHHEMGTKRTHEGREVKEDAPTGEAHRGSQGSSPQAKGASTEATSNGTSPSSASPPAPPKNTPLTTATQPSVNGASNGSSNTNTTTSAGASFGQLTDATTSRPWQSPQLLYHALHHTNIVVALLSTYLSQDALVRDFMNSQRNAGQLPLQHHTIAAALIVARDDMKQCRQALPATDKFEEYREKGTFRTWWTATDKLSLIVDSVAWAYRANSLPSAQDVATMKSTWEECMALRQGTDQHEAWQLCWDLLLSRP